jgi:Protein of unknown function (DUF2971)
MVEAPVDKSELNADSAKPEGRLYHYTDQNGLLGIIKTKAIWATHLRYLNDTSEGEIVSRVVWEELNSRVNSDSLMQSLGMPPVEPTGKIECNDEEIFSQGASIASWVTSQDVFVTSFSEQGNLLSQWRAYSGGFGGYSIGFSRGYLGAVGEHFLQDRKGRFYSDSNTLVGCRYYDDDEETHLKNDVENLVTSYINEAILAKQSSSEAGKSGFNTPGAIALRLFLSLGTRSAITKDKAFREEAEWRFALHLNRDIAHSDLEFRAGRSMITPYFKVPLEWEGQPIDIEEIIVGPCPHRDDAKKSVQMMLKKEGISGVEVIPSKIPYRNW